jgi:hypothetical protein
VSIKKKKKNVTNVRDTVLLIIWRHLPPNAAGEKIASEPNAATVLGSATLCQT